MQHWRAKSVKWALLGLGLTLAAAAAFVLNVSRAGPPTPIGVPADGVIPATLTVATLNLWHDYPYYARSGADRRMPARGQSHALRDPLARCLSVGRRSAPTGPCTHPTPAFGLPFSACREGGTRG